MKNTDIAFVILIAAISVLLSYWIGGMLMGDPNESVYETRYMDSISGTLAMPDGETFNPTMINPTEEIYVGKCNKDTEVEDPETHQCMLKSDYKKQQEQQNQNKNNTENDNDQEGGASGTGSESGDDNTES